LRIDRSPRKIEFDSSLQKVLFPVKLSLGIRLSFRETTFGGIAMRSWIACGVVCVGSTFAPAQSPNGPAPITAAPPPAATAPPSYQQIASSVPVARAPVSAAPAANLHPWYVKAEHGQWMLCVKSYSGDESKVLAETLAREIRETYKTPAYLFERGSEEKIKEEARARQIGEKQREEQQREFLKIADQLRAEAFRKGYDFQETQPKLRVPKIRYSEQYAVLVGGWSDMETARKALDVIRTWQPPANKHLMDSSFSSGEGKKGQTSNVTGGYLNPFKLAMVVPNPSAPRTLSADAGADPLVLQMNNEEPLSVLKIQKPWTIVVKSFHAPLVDIKDKDAGSVMSIRKLFNSRPEHLNKTAELGVNLAKMLRNIKPSPFESYVLHTLNGTLVCVGQFDSLEDPRLAELQPRLEGLRFHVEGKEISPFDKLVGMRVR
jgi:hypothetical protein